MLCKAYKIGDIKILLEPPSTSNTFVKTHIEISFKTRNLSTHILFDRPKTKG